MSANNPTGSVALRPWPAPVKEEFSFNDVFDQVHRLALQRGHLRSVTEKALQDEIETGKDAAGDIMEGVEKGDGEEESKPAQSREDRRIEVMQMHAEMRKKLDLVRFAATNALDVVSLILTKDSTKKVPDQAFSPLFKEQKIPRASFGIDKVTEPAKKPHDIQREEEHATVRTLASKGSRIKTLEWAVDDILRAATQLETEVRKETQYWDEILSISQKGWSLHKQRKDQRQSPFLVRFGHPEASGQFKARGAAPLRMAKEGGIILDPALRLQPKTLRVRIRDNGKITGSSTLPAQGDTTDLAIERAVRFARDSLFEEELFHEISQESRQLIPFGVEVRNSIVHVTTPSLSGKSAKRTVLIDCVERSDDVAGATGLPQDRIAGTLAESLRLLMAHEHRMRLFRRSRVPQPLSQHKRSPPSPPLLRPVLAMINHLNAVDSLQKHLRVVVKVLRSAGLDLTLQCSRDTAWETLEDIITDPIRTGLSPADQLLELFIKPLDGLATLSLPSSTGSEAEKLTIATKTIMGPPTFGTGFKITVPQSLVSVLNLSEDQPRDFRFSAVAEVKSYINWVLSLDLTHTLLFREYSKRAVLRSKDPQVTIVRWKEKKRYGKDVSVKISRGLLVLTVVPTYATETTASTQKFTWNGKGHGTSFRGKVQSLVS